MIEYILLLTGNCPRLVVNPRDSTDSVRPNSTDSHTISVGGEWNFSVYNNFTALLRTTVPNVFDFPGSTSEVFKDEAQTPTMNYHNLLDGSPYSCYGLGFGSFHYGKDRNDRFKACNKFIG